MPGFLFRRLKNTSSELLDHLVKVATFFSLGRTEVDCIAADLVAWKMDSERYKGEKQSMQRVTGIMQNYKEVSLHANSARFQSVSSEDRVSHETDSNETHKWSTVCVWLYCKLEIFVHHLFS